MLDESSSGSKRLELVTLGGGCFWCTEAVFSLIRGVEKVEPGYAGGYKPNPTYAEVSSGRTGYVEVAQLSFDPSLISFKEILEIFFATHDSTTLNRQGPDVGTQYRSVIFYHTEEQKRTAEQMIRELEETKTYTNPIVTKVEPLRNSFKAETYHKDYYKQHPNAPYCQAIISPKIQKPQKKYITKLRIPL